MRPNIGITAPSKFYPAYYFLRFAVWLCGGRPVALRTLESIQRGDIDGLIVGGGTDVFPGLFQNDPKQDYLYDQKRDEMEIAWLAKAEKEGLPVLGICRGRR